MTGLQLSSDVVFLIDVDNTLIDNVGIVFDLRNHLVQHFGTARAGRFRASVEELRIDYAIDPLNIATVTAK